MTRASLPSRFDMIPPDPQFLPRLSRLIEDLIEKRGWQFGCTSDDGKPIPFTAATVAAPTLLLPLVLHRCEFWMNEAMGRRAPMSYRLTYEPLDGQAQPPPCGVVPEPSAPTASVAIWCCFASFALDELAGRHLDIVAKRGLIPLDPWYADWVMARDHRMVTLLAPRASAPRPAQQPPRPIAKPVQNQPVNT
jgi:hypothetical protein